MGRAVWIGATVVFAAGAGLLLYQNADQRRQQDRVLAGVRTQGESARAQLEQIASQQQEIRHTLSETQDMLAATTDTTSIVMRMDLPAIAAMRVAIAEYYATTAKMPATNSDAGLPAPDEYRGKSLKSATVLADGRIELVFDAQSGMEDGRIFLVPDTTHADAMGIQWNCETPDYPLVKRVAPTCEYKPAQAAVRAPASAIKVSLKAG
ncbi:MAG: pilin [Dokdonella sp.]